MPENAQPIEVTKKAILVAIPDGNPLLDPPPATPVIAMVGERLAEIRGRGVRESEIIGSLLCGTGTLFGARVELSWPDGLPEGFTEETLKDFGRSMLGRSDV